jgi:caspase domain-containing protein
VSGQRKALIVANDQYEQDALSNLLAPGADAEALGRVLGDRQIGGFTVRVVKNEPAHVLQAQIEDLFAESRADDVLLLHFSGHGLKSESGELFFAASNTRPNRLRATAVSADFVRLCMRDSRSRSIVLLLDCCYGGAFAQGVKIRAAGDVNVLDSFPQGRSGGHGRAVITASNAMEYAFEGDRLADDQQQHPSVFTSALVEGLTTGDADRDEDGWVSLNELYDYVFDKVRETNPHQTPSRQVELEGELYLARSRRRRIHPAPIPADLRAAITDQNMYTRRGAVHELQSRLASEDLPVAAGAYEALAGVARTDIQYVADLAAAALSEASVRPEVTELHFGEQRQGSEPPHRLVRLLGPPIARACAPRASHDWIRVDETAEGLDISVETTSTGTLHGSVELKGPAGLAEIALDIELLPQAAQTPLTGRPSRSAGERVMVRTSPADQPKGRPARSAPSPTPKDLVNEEPIIPEPDVPERSGGRHTAIQEGTEIPAMPDIAPSEEFADTPHPLVDGLSPTIGWQFRPQRKGGPAFMIIRRGTLGSLKVVETFPLTEDGWASAWQSLIQQNPAAVPKILAILRARAAGRQG